MERRRKLSSGAQDTGGSVKVSFDRGGALLGAINSLAGGYEGGGTRTVVVNGQTMEVDSKGYPTKDGYINPLGYDWGIPNPFVSPEKREALRIQRESARNNTGWGRAGQVLRGERFITGGTREQLEQLQRQTRGYEEGGTRTVVVNGQTMQVDSRGYPTKDGYINPLGYGWGIPNPFVSDQKREALQQQRMTARNNTGWGRGIQVMRGERFVTGGTPEDLRRIRGYAAGGSSKSAFGVSYSNQISVEERVDKLEEALKYLGRSMNSSAPAQPASRPAPRTAPSSSPVNVSDQSSSTMDSATIINVIASSGGNSSVPVNRESTSSTATFMSNPWPSGMAGVLCSSPWGVYN